MLGYNSQCINQSYLRFASVYCIFELIERLSDRIGVGYFSIINKRDVFDTPSDKISCKLTPKRASA